MLSCSSLFWVLSFFRVLTPNLFLASGDDFADIVHVAQREVGIHRQRQHVSAGRERNGGFVWIKPTRVAGGFARERVEIFAREDVVRFERVADLVAVCAKHRRVKRNGQVGIVLRNAVANRAEAQPRDAGEVLAVARGDQRAFCDLPLEILEV